MSARIAGSGSSSAGLPLEGLTALLLRAPPPGHRPRPPVLAARREGHQHPCHDHRPGPTTRTTGRPVALLLVTRVTVHRRQQVGAHAPDARRGPYRPKPD